MIFNLSRFHNNRDSKKQRQVFDEPLQDIQVVCQDPQVRQLLASVTTMTLSTSDGGYPHATPVYFVSDEKLHLFFFSDVKSLHSRHIWQQPLIAAAIYPQCLDWKDIRGIQIHGIISQVESPEAWETAWTLYQQKFPFVRGLKAIVAQNQMYVLAPTWIRLVDNSQGFGFKQEYGTTQPR